MCNHRKKAKGVTRRDVLRYGAAGATTLALMGPMGNQLLPEASGAIATQSHLTFINLFGGNDFSLIAIVVGGIARIFGL